jgi:hypothetical protein
MSTSEDLIGEARKMLASSQFEGAAAVKPCSHVGHGALLRAFASGQSFNRVRWWSTSFLERPPNARET